jgi:ornithine cyclodeaminase/alanine dehydrogenase-like protein (mu-crystallin family)
VGERTLRYLSARDVAAAMPDVAQRLALARSTLVALVDSAELPPKLGVHPRQPASHTAAMPALLRGDDRLGADDLLGVKWVTAFPDNRRTGLPAIHALVVLNDALSGAPIAVIDGAPITAQRTAAVSGVALQEWWPGGSSASVSVALIGAGVQAASHVEVLQRVGRGARVTIADRHLDRAQELAAATRAIGAFTEVAATTDAVAAATSADVVLTMVSFGPDRQSIPAVAFETASLIVSVDYDMCVPAAVVAEARLFLTDDIAQFEAARTDSVFAGYPRPDASLGEFLTGSAPARRRRGPVVVNHLGVGLSDIVFADAILRRARDMGIGIELPT